MLPTRLICPRIRSCYPPKAFFHSSQTTFNNFCSNGRGRLHILPLKKSLLSALCSLSRLSLKRSKVIAREILLATAVSLCKWYLLKHRVVLHFLLSSSFSHGVDAKHSRVRVCSPSQSFEHSPHAPQLLTDCPAIQK